MSAWKALYVTSFVPEIYEATGKKLLDTFIKSHSGGRMLACPERCLGMEIPSGDHRILRHDLDEHPMLARFLNEFSTHIPEDLGGKAGPCKCKDVEGPYSKKHVKGCHQSWFNRHASRWFRKIVAINIALDNYCQGVDFLIWIDCDCHFRKNVTEERLLEWFRGTSCFYFKSTRRQVLEAGLVGYFLTRKGRTIIDLTTERYLSGKFLTMERWDDSYQIQKSIKRAAEMGVRSVDLGRTISGHADVIPNSPAGAFIQHDKGTHGRILKIMV